VARGDSRDRLEAAAPRARIGHATPRGAIDPAEASVVISPRGVERLRSGHLWVYRSDVLEAQAEPGAIVRVSDERGNFQGRAFYSDKSQITVRLLTREDVPIDRAFWKTRFLRAAEFRRLVVENSDAYRLVYSEGDLLPSLIVDRYGDYLVIQTLSQSTDRIQGLLVEILVELFSPRGILERNDPKVRLLEGLKQRVGVLYGEVPAEITVQENGSTFICEPAKSQKTGSFLDQRENHWAARRYASGHVLDCFSYQGGFALTVADRSTHVQGIDMAPAAVELARRNQKLNSISNVDFRQGNTFDILKEYSDSERRFQMIILDPPAFAKNRDSIPAARRGYKEINLRAMKLLTAGGFLVTCSCSYHISEATLLEIVAEAANDAHKNIAVVERRTQSRDHPILLTVPETHYLKCLILKVLD
jgi:23S rRNA (cytosine1962-C5)-methyltransferase